MSTPVGPYSPILRAGEFLITSGQLGLAPGADGTPGLVPGGTIPQLSQALANGLKLLESEGAKITDIVKATVFLTDMTEFPSVNEVWVNFFDGHQPTRSAIGVAALPMGATIEVELWAHVSSSNDYDDCELLVVKKHGLIVSLVDSVISWLDPEEHASGVVYGMIAVGTVMTFEGPNKASPARDIGAAVIVLFLYWLAHAYSSVMGHLYKDKQIWKWPIVRQSLLHETAILRGGFLPILAMALAVVAGASDTAVSSIGMGTVVVLLMLFQGTAGFRAGMRGFALLGQIFIGLLFGAALVGVKYVLGH